MSLTDWISESHERINQYGLGKGGAESAKAFWTGVLTRVGQTVNYGTNVYDYDWDVLLVLDTCRPDVLTEVADEYDYIPDQVPTINSVGSASPEWLAKTFSPTHAPEHQAAVASTAYVTGNLFSDGLEPEHVYDAEIDQDLFEVYDEVWRYGWDNEYETTPPEALADRAIATAREHDPEHLIVHFMQPHTPYRKLYDKYPEWFDSTHTGDEDDAPHRRDRDWRLWERLRHDVISREEVWEAYKDNLRWVLNDGVDPILKNVDADDVVITADHGEAFDDWGLYAHPHHVPLPVLKRVPWVSVSATDTGQYKPSLEPTETHVAESEVDDRLEALGYK